LNQGDQESDEGNIWRAVLGLSLSLIAKTLVKSSSWDSPLPYPPHLSSIGNCFIVNI
jgi:hypothetical protein